MMTSLLLSLLAPAQAAPSDADRFTLGLPAEVDLIGTAVGVAPELLWRPVDPEGWFHVRASVGAKAGPEFALLPVSLGVRGSFLTQRRVHPLLGTGLRLQTFLPYGTDAVVRGDMYFEAGLAVDLDQGWSLALHTGPEFGAIGGFGLGLAARVGVQKDLPW